MTRMRAHTPGGGDGRLDGRLVARQAHDLGGLVVRLHLDHPLRDQRGQDLPVLRALRDRHELAARRLHHFLAAERGEELWRWGVGLQVDGAVRLTQVES